MSCKPSKRNLQQSELIIQCSLEHWAETIWLILVWKEIQPLFYLLDCLIQVGFATFARYLYIGIKCWRCAPRVDLYVCEGGSTERLWVKSACEAFASCDDGGIHALVTFVRDRLVWDILRCGKCSGKKHAVRTGAPVYWCLRVEMSTSIEACRRGIGLSGQTEKPVPQGWWGSPPKHLLVNYLPNGII